MLRYQFFLSHGIVFLALWYGALLKHDILVEKVPLPTELSSRAITYAPFILILLLGVYAAASVFVGVLNFSDCPDAAGEIERQIKEAKAALIKKGVKL